jgi:hypothetical protein
MAMWRTMRRLGSQEQLGRARWVRARGSFCPIAVVMADLACRCGVAHAEPRPNEIFDWLSWVLILPLGIVQIAAAAWVRGQIGKSVVGWPVLATWVSIAAGIAVAGSLDQTLLRPTMLALYFCPGIPTFITLARRQLWAPALLMFSLLPGLLAILPR